jgi:hypothetical protein
MGCQLGTYLIGFGAGPDQDLFGSQSCLVLLFEPPTRYYSEPEVRGVREVEISCVEDLSACS